MFLASHLFQQLSDDSIHFHRIERFTVILYDKTSSLSSVDEAREDLFCHKNRAMDRIPPTTNALLQHVSVLYSKQEFGQPALKQTLNFLLH